MADSRWQTALPIPLDPPVTNAYFMMIFLSDAIIERAFLWGKRLRFSSLQEYDLRETP